MENLELKSDTFLPLRDVVFHTLREAILKGDLKPGERLMELQLAEQLGVSRTPIREAIRMLQQEGLAVSIPRKGAEVAKMTEKNMEDVLKIREALEILAAQLACDTMTDEQFGYLAELEDVFARAVRSDNLKQLAQADIDFHDFICQAAGNRRLTTMLSHLREQIYRYRVEYLKDKENYPCLIEEHKQILSALLAKDKELVAARIKKHLENQQKAVKDIIRRQE